MSQHSAVQHNTAVLSTAQLGTAQHRSGTFSTPEGVRSGWSLSSPALHDTVAKPSRRGTFSTPEG
eukprot:5230865-Pyramimonas_sp.AAC.1